MSEHVSMRLSSSPGHLRFCWALLGAVGLVACSPSQPGTTPVNNGGGGASNAGVGGNGTGTGGRPAPRATPAPRASPAPRATPAPRA